MIKELHDKFKEILNLNKNKYLNLNQICIKIFQELNLWVDEVESNKNLLKKYLDKNKVGNNNINKTINKCNITKDILI